MPNKPDSPAKQTRFKSPYVGAITPQMLFGFNKQY